MQAHIKGDIFRDDSQRDPLEFMVCQWLGNMPLIAGHELAEVMEQRPAAVYEVLGDLKDKRLVTTLNVGLLKSRQDRWLLTRVGIDATYTTDHVHPTDGQWEMMTFGDWSDSNIPLVMQKTEWHHFHAHHDRLRYTPYSTGDPDHAHVPWQATESGIATLIERIPALEMAYGAAPRVLKEPGVSVVGTRDRTPDVRRLTRFQWMSGDRSFWAVAGYGHDVWVLVIWVGTQDTVATFRRRWDRLWQGRGRREAPASYSDDHEYRVTISPSPYDPPGSIEVIAPRPSGIVVLAADARAADIASEVMGPAARPMTAIFVNGKAVSGSWTLTPSLDAIMEEKAPARIGRPEKALEPPDTVRTKREKKKHQTLRALTALGDVQTYRIFSLIERWPAIRQTHLRTLTNCRLPEVTAALRALVDAELALQRDRHYYVGSVGIDFLQRRDGADLSRVRGRYGAYADDESNRRNEQLQHNIGLLRLVLAFAREGITLEPGWRRVINVPEDTQVSPDALVPIEDGAGAITWVCLEYEKSARASSRVAKKLEPYKKVASDGQPQRILFVCDTMDAVREFQRQREGLALLTAILKDAVRGPLRGPGSVWM